jgi:hypothetical protein
MEMTPVGNNQFDGEYDEFNQQGIYQVVVYARDRLGNTAVPKLTTITVQNSYIDRAVVVAGGSSGQPSWQVVSQHVKLVYDTLSFQGFTDDLIYLLAPASVEKIPKTTLTNTLDNVSYAISRWPGETTRDLIVYFTGPGGQKNFKLNTDQEFTSVQLNTWLKTIETKISGRVIIVYDADYSGGFIADLIPSQGKERIVITSTKDSEKAGFYSENRISFSGFFWRQVMNGMNIRNSFNYARAAIRYCNGQLPQLDDNANGKGNEKQDGRLARRTTIGTGIMLAGDDPIIGSISGDQLLQNGTSVNIEVKDITSTGEVNKVWAVISPPSTGGGDLKASEISLLNVNNDGTYSGVWDQFSDFGTYKIAAFAVGKNGSVSLPAVMKVTQSGGFENIIQVLRVLSMQQGIGPDASGDKLVDLIDVQLLLQHSTGAR